MAEETNPVMTLDCIGKIFRMLYTSLVFIRRADIRKDEAKQQREHLDRVKARAKALWYKEA